VTTARSFGTGRIELVQGDITRQTIDAIVNAANSSLMGGGGVDGAIHRAGGPAILEECRLIRERQGPLPPGDAVATTGGRLQCRRVIHTVGPIWRGGDEGEPETLARCYRSCIDLARGEGLTSIAFPSISTGVYGYPVDRAAEVALATVRDALRAGEAITLARWVLFSRPDLQTYAMALAALPD
jgi:O-acetyl-ADP-ribose deacetylase